MPKEIDLLKLKNRVDKHPYIYFTLDKNNLPLTISALTSMSTAAIFRTIPTYIFASLYTTEQLYFLYKRYQVFTSSGNTISYHKVNEAIKNSEEYKECKELYTKYINNIAEFLHIFHFSSSKELLVFMEHMLIMGVFTQNFTHEYYIHKVYYEYANDLLGASVLTGKSVCRHMASLFNDVLNAYGHTSSFLVVRTTTQNSISDVIKERNKEFSHAVIGIKEEQEKYIYDPTDGVFASNIKETANPALNIGVAKTITQKDIGRYYVLGPDQIELKPFDSNNLLDVVNLPFKIISFDEINYYTKEATNKFLNNTSLAHDFHIENHELVKQIVELINKINPVSDSKVTEWKLTKSKK